MDNKIFLTYFHIIFVCGQLLHNENKKTTPTESYMLLNLTCFFCIKVVQFEILIFFLVFFSPL